MTSTPQGNRSGWVSSLQGPQALSRIGKTGGSALIEIVREGTAGQFIEASGAERVSVIIPAFNVAPYIAETLKAVFAQTKSAFEVIVVNDGSPDTEKLEEALEPFRNLIQYLKQENRGLSGARNTGVRAAKGILSHSLMETIFGCRSTSKRKRNFCVVILTTISCIATQCSSAIRLMKPQNS
jgi:cellulose synthase/poly-beta-1,6-N-acetylglucosamine synthase-like glycosyltransferase